MDDVINARGHRLGTAEVESAMVSICRHHVIPLSLLLLCVLCVCVLVYIYGCYMCVCDFVCVCVLCMYKLYVCVYTYVCVGVRAGMNISFLFTFQVKLVPYSKKLEFGN